MDVEELQDRYDRSPPEQHSLARTAKDLFAGAAGGVAQVLLGQPFDIVKVRLQTASTDIGAVATATNIWKNEGPLAFYKGTLTPLIGIGACVSVQFGAFHWARRYFESRNAESSPLPSSLSKLSSSSPPPPLSYTQYYLSGAFAGIANSVLSGPIEHVRIRLQTQPHGSARLYAGPLDCIRKLTTSIPAQALSGATAGATATAGARQHHTGPAGRHFTITPLFRGQTITFWREAQAYGIWFLTFEYLMNTHCARSGTVRKDVPAGMVALYGGIAGEALWLASYPFDVVKSKMQTDGFGPRDRRYRNMRDCFSQTWAREGMAGFWKGIGPTLLRAMPVSAGTFAVVEMTMRLLDS